MAAKRVELELPNIPQLGHAQLADYSVLKFDSPESWRLTSTEDKSTEASFRIQGILCAFELPPVLPKARNIDQKRLFIRQSARLTGLSTDAFSKAAVACEGVYAKMSSHFPAQSILPWQACLYEGHTAIDFNARYFTKRTDAPNESNHPFLQGVDPQGVLEKLRKHDLIHGPDNQVEYIKLLENDRYTKIDPGTFQIGDIVEATVTFVVLPIKGGRYVIIPQLKVLTLLDRLQAVSKSQVVDVKSHQSSGPLKRKRLYVTEDNDEDTRHKMGRMQIC